MITPMYLDKVCKIRQVFRVISNHTILYNYPFFLNSASSYKVIFNDDLID